MFMIIPILCYCLIMGLLFFLGELSGRMMFKKKYHVKSLKGVRSIEIGEKTVANFCLKNQGEYVVHIDEYMLYIKNRDRMLECLEALRENGYDIYLEIDMS